MPIFTANLEEIGKYDVIVCGGGSAGFCAAVAAARAGAKVALIEKYSMLGGIMTVGGNPVIGLFYAHGRQIIKGIGWEFVERLKEEGWARYPDFENERYHGLLNVAVNPFMAALYMDKMCIENNIDLLFENQVAGVIKGEDGHINSVVTSSKNGLQAFRANVFIDCTGDGDLSTFAGADSEFGGEDGELQPGTLAFYITGCNMKDLDTNQVEEAYRTALVNEELKNTDYWPMKTPKNILSSSNTSIHLEFNALDKEAVITADIESKKAVERIIKWARKNVKGAEKAEAKILSSDPVRREWRRIKCHKQVTCEDYLSGKKYEDAVCYSFYPIDLHSAKGSQLYKIYLEDGVFPVIPYQALVVKGFSNLLVAGRCIDSDRLANSALRVKASCMAMGHAAGVAAAIAARKNLPCIEVDVDEIKKLLAEQNAIITV